MCFATIRDGDVLTGARLDGDILVLLDATDAVDAYLRRGTLRETGERDAANAHYARFSPTRRTSRAPRGASPRRLREPRRDGGRALQTVFSPFPSWQKSHGRSTQSRSAKPSPKYGI
jgi:hypothetical protein